MILFILPILLLVGCQKKEQEGEFVPNVTVKAAVSMRIPITIDAIGHVVAYNSAQIKAQVEGRLLEVNYVQGKEVKQNDLLLKIDPRPYEAERDRAIATRAENNAKLRFMAERVARYEKLLPDNYVSPLNYTEYVSDLGTYEAAIMRDDADIRLAEIKLDYCYIRAPFTGVVGKKLVDIGNLVTNNGDTLVTINQIDPIYFDFSIPERDFSKLMQSQKEKNLDVSLLLSDKTYTAKLTVVDNKISRGTGMLPLRAEIANPNKVFWPGQFIAAKVILKWEDAAVLVPVEAQGIGQQGLYVYVIKEDNTAEYRPIKVGERVDHLIQILEGVKAGEQVVTKGQLDVEPGKKVNIK